MNLKGIAISLLAMLLFVGCATQQERAERRAKMKQAVEEAVAHRQLHINISSMNTLRYGARTVTSSFFLELRGDTLCSYLSYLGQAHRAPMFSPSIGLNFEAPVLRLTESRPKANLSRLAIDVKNQEDSYHYIIELYDSGDAYIHVNSGLTHTYPGANVSKGCIFCIKKLLIRFIWLVHLLLLLYKRGIFNIFAAKIQQDATQYAAGNQSGYSEFES